MEELVGITALEIQLPCSVVEVPDVPQVALRALWALLHLRRGDYDLPQYATTLVQQLSTADLLGAEAFLSLAGEKLCVPSSLLNCSNSLQDIHRTVRIRYRLATKSSAKVPPRNVCYMCKLSLKEATEFRVVCCGWVFHKACIANKKQCPFCKEPRVALPCYFCKKIL